MRSREERREDERRYQGDVTYEVWRRGGNSDRVDRDRVRDCFDDGLSSETAASREMRRQQPRPSDEEQFPEDQ